MAFENILFESNGHHLNGNKVEVEAPDFSPYLIRDQIIEAITSKK